MKFDLYLSTTINTTIGRYNYNLEFTSCYWCIYKRVDHERGMVVLQFGPVSYVRMDNEKQDKWFEKLVVKAREGEQDVECEDAES